MSSDARARAVERVQKLLRLAAPGNGTTEAERTNAALEVAKIIAEHGLSVAVPPPVVKKRRKPPSAQQQHWPPPRVWVQPYRPSGSDWVEVEVYTRCTCVVCGSLLGVGESAWFAPDHGYRHYDITCDQ